MNQSSRFPFLLTLLIAAVTLLATPAHAAKRAFVAGIAEYKVEGVVSKDISLPHAKNDATDMAQALRELGFDVTEKIKDMEYASFKGSLRAFIDKVKVGDEVVIYYSGHGITSVKGGLTMLVPANSPRYDINTKEGILHESYIVLDTELEVLAERKPRVTVVILDACRTYPIISPGAASVGWTAGLNTTKPAPEGQITLYAAGHLQPAFWDARQTRNSLYTSVLLTLIKQPFQNVESLAKSVGDKVKALAESYKKVQRPSYQASISGDYSFVPLPAPSSAADKAEIERLRLALAKTQAVPTPSVAARTPTPIILPPPATSPSKPPTPLTSPTDFTFAYSDAALQRFKQYPQFQPLVLGSESISNNEKQYWFDLIPSMTHEQIKRLETIFITEREQLLALDVEFREELKKLNTKHEK